MANTEDVELEVMPVTPPTEDDAPPLKEAPEASLLGADSTPTRTPEEARQFSVEMITCMLLLWASESSRGLIVTELPAYVSLLGGSKTFLSSCVAAFSFGRLPASIVFGWWSERQGARLVLRVSIFLALLGNLLYCLAASMESKWVLLIGRLLAGFGTGNFSVVRAHIAAITTKGERTRYLGWGGAMQFVGFGLMPSIAGLFASVSFGPTWLPFTGNTLPGWMLVALNTGLLIGTGALSLGDSKKASHRAGDREGRLPRLVLIAVWICISLNFLARGILSLIEVLGPYDFPLVWQDDDGDANSDTANFFTALGAAGLVVYIGVDFIPKRHFSELWQLVTGFIALSVGAYSYAIWGGALHGFAIATFFMWSIGSPLTQTLTLSIFSKILADHPQGMWMGIMGSAGSFGRILFPFAAVMPEAVAFGISGTLAWVIAGALLLGVRLKWITMA